MKREEIVKSQGEKINAEISLGDHIFEAKERLIAAGFKIKYGPDFPTKTREYLLMIVDYGVRPSRLDTFKYSVGIGGGADPITGIIKSDAEGTITSIE